MIPVVERRARTPRACTHGKAACGLRLARPIKGVVRTARVLSHTGQKRVESLLGNQIVLVRHGMATVGRLASAQDDDEGNQDEDENNDGHDGDGEVFGRFGSIAATA